MDQTERAEMADTFQYLYQAAGWLLPSGARYRW